MARIPQYISTEATNNRGFNERRATPQGVDMRPVISGALQAGDDMRRMELDQAATRRHLAEVQQRENKRLETDEAVMAVDSAVSQGRSMFLERMTKAEQDGAGAGFTDAMLKDFDSWANSQREAIQHPAARKVLEHQINTMRQGLHADAFRFETGQRTKGLVAQYGAGLDADRRAVMADPSQFTALAAMRQATAETLQLPAETRAKLAADAREALAFDAAQSLVDKDARGFLERAGVRSAKGAKGQQGGQQQDAAQRMAADPLLSSLSPEAMRRTVDRASTIVAQQEAAAAADAERRARLAEIEANKRARAADQAWGILSGRAMSGIVTDPKADAQLFSAIAGTPYAKEYQRMATQVAQRTAVAMQPLPQQQATLDALMAQRATGTSTALEDEIKARRQVLDAAQRSAADSPLRAAQAYGLLQMSALDTTSVDSLVAGLPVRSQQAAVAGQHVGAPASPLLPEEARKVAGMLQALPPNQRGEQIARLAAAMPPDQAQALARQIDTHDKPLALAMAAGASRTTQGRTVAELVLRGAQAIKDKSIKEEQGAEFGTRASLAKVVGDSVPAAARESVIETARLVYLAKQAEGNGISHEGALRLAIGGDLVEHNGRRVPVPVGVDLPQALRAVSRNSIDAQAQDGWLYLAGGRQIGVPEFMAGLPDAQLEPAGMGRYMVRSGGSLVMGKNRRPVLVEVAR